MDPEDVRRLLQPYHARVRTELERHGGTVEKFIGDAVMAVFGAPIAHEDDPEHLQNALAFCRSLGATRYTSQTEALLTEAGLETPA